MQRFRRKGEHRWTQRPFRRPSEVGPTFFQNGFVLNGALFEEFGASEVLVPPHPTFMPERKNLGRARFGATPTSGFGRTRLGGCPNSSTSSSADETWASPNSSPSSSEFVLEPDEHEGEPEKEEEKEKENFDHGESPETQRGRPSPPSRQRGGALAKLLRQPLSRAWRRLVEIGDFGEGASRRAVAELYLHVLVWPRGGSPGGRLEQVLRDAVQRETDSRTNSVLSAQSRRRCGCPSEVGPISPKAFSA